MTYYPLFKHMADEHGLTLLGSELYEIALLVQRCDLGESLRRYRCDRLAGLIARDFADILRGWFNERYPAPENVRQWEARDWVPMPLPTRCHDRFSVSITETNPASAAAICAAPDFPVARS